MQTTPNASRRSILRATWAVPAVTIAAAAPSYATSHTDPPKLDCRPKGNRSQRHDGKRRKWDYHVAPGCGAVVACVWIGGEPATYEKQGKRWTVRDLGGDRAKAVHIVAKSGASWSGMVVFS